MLFTTKGSDVPATVRKWIEKRLERKILKSEEVTVWAVKPSGKREREETLNRWERDKKGRERRLARVANKMLKAGLSETDADPSAAAAGRIELRSHPPDMVK
jgi:hypothetical protein